LAPVAIPRRDNDRFEEVFGPNYPTLTLKASRDIGCILKITLPDWFWEQISKKDAFVNLQKHDISKDPMCGTVDLWLVRISPLEFTVHAPSTEKEYTKALKARNEARIRFGWKGKSQSDMYGNKSGDERTNVAEHKYCDVFHDAI
jgi:hypothetical protein